MARNERVVILRSGNRFVVEPTTRPIMRLLAPLLSYEEVVQLQGYEYTRAKKAHKPTTYTQPWECFVFDHKGRLGTSMGFYDRVVDALYAAGYDVRQRTLYDHPDPSVFKPRWDRVEGEFRYKQKDALKVFLEYENGRIDCAPAWGKGTVIRMAAQMFPRAKIGVATKRVAVLQQRLYPELCDYLPSVGIVGGGMKIKNRRVMCYTFGSLHHADKDLDILFVDECHEAAADDAAGKLAEFDHCKMFGLSASHDMRIDNKDMRCEALFGPIRLTVTNQEAVREGMILPTEVIWGNVSMDYDPAVGVVNPVEKKRLCYWTNRTRNRAIKRDARMYDDDVQVLINVDTVEHGLHLQRMLPEFYFVYDGTTVTPDKIKAYKKQGLIDDDFELITRDQRARWTRKFEQGKIKKAIATTIWNVGVNFTGLAVLIRGDGGSSPINDTQIPGRPGRINGEKTVARVHDYLDQFNVGCNRRATGRSGSYHDNGFKQIFPTGRVLEGAKERGARKKKASKAAAPKSQRVDMKKKFTLRDALNLEDE